MPEQWRNVIGYEGSYQVSDLGRVRSVDRVVRGPRGEPKRLRGRILQANAINPHGHLAVNISKEGIIQTTLVHRLVAATWIGPCPEDQQVRHGPNGVTDNSASNLCYGTPSEDGFDRRRDGTHGGKPVRRSDGVEFINLSVAAEETGCPRSSIGNVCNGRRNLKTTGGFGWEFI